MPEPWAGTDAGKTQHHCTTIDANATVVLSRRVPNDETELLQLLGAAAAACAARATPSSPPC
ncbi:transposase [Embleya sp. NPDC050493]|uniref:IS110 family transposase n=1 Tax=Embleya sp. NPDC050493 TaxID=3363989 RepID=UPI003791E0A5